MADRTGTESRERRTAARKRRRSLASKPFEELDEAARGEDADGDSSDGDSRARSALKQAAVTALAGAVAAGLGGAARALVDRRTEDRGGEDADQSPDVSDEETEPASARDDEPSEDQETDEDAAETEEPAATPQAEAAEPADDAADEDAPTEDGDGGDGDEPEREERDERPTGVSAGDAKAAVDKARGELEELLGAEVESISGFQRSNGRWTVTAEVVQVHRIPESTDVLASYQVELDDDRNLVGINEVRRYRRSQVEEG